METTKSYCNECNKETNHEIIAKHEVSGPEEYNCLIQYMIVKCSGCDHVSFRYVFHDYEQAYPVGAGPDCDWDYPMDIKTFPSVVENNSGITDMTYISEIVGKIYNETLIALREKAFILAGLGFRAIIEAICNDKKVKGNNLEQKISNLNKLGLISKNDSERLHSIRFLGNDAAHDIKTPNPESLIVAQKIIEHLMVTLYILDSQASGLLERIITDYKEFKDLLISKIPTLNSGEEYTLSIILGKDRRRLLGLFTDFEKKLIDEIQSGAFSDLILGKLLTGKGSRNLQYFKKV